MVGPSGMVGTFLAVNVDVGMVRQRSCHILGKIIAAHSQRTARGHCIAVGNVNDLAPHLRHLIFENAQRPIGQGAAHGIAADQFGQAIGCVRFGRALRTHLVQVNLDVAVGHLPCSLTTGQPAAHNRHLFHCLPPWPDRTRMTRMQRICTDFFREIRVDPAQSLLSVSHCSDGRIVTVSEWMPPEFVSR